MIRFDKVYEKVQEDSKIKKHKTIRDFWRVFHDLSTKPATQKQKNTRGRAYIFSSSNCKTNPNMMTDAIAISLIHDVIN